MAGTSRARMGDLLGRWPDDTPGLNTWIDSFGACSVSARHVSGQRAIALSTTGIAMNTKTLIAIGVVLAAGAAVGAYNVFGPTYADVVSAEPITVKEPILANVLSATAIKETVTGTRQVCEDRVVERRAQERFGDKDGMVVGALVGGLLGNQVGGGRGRDPFVWRPARGGDAGGDLAGECAEIGQAEHRGGLWASSVLCALFHVRTGAGDGE